MHSPFNVSLAIHSPFSIVLRVELDELDDDDWLLLELDTDDELDDTDIPDKDDDELLELDELELDELDDELLDELEDDD